MNPRMITLLVILATVAGCSAFFLAFDRVPSSRFVPASGEARLNPFLAAQLLLEKTGYEADALVQLDFDRIDYEDTIVTRLDDVGYAPPQRESVTDWVQSGGHLVLEVRRPPEAAIADWLAGFGYKARWLDKEAGNDVEGLVEAGLIDDENFRLPNDRLRFDDLDDSGVYTAVTDQFGIIVGRRVFGNGVITVVSGSRFSNYDLVPLGARFSDTSDYDAKESATLLLDIVAGEFSPGRVWFLYRVDYPSLWQQLRENAPLLLWSAGLLLLLALWSAVQRFGPLFGEADQRRRSVVEHIAASGRFSWRTRQMAAMTATSIDGVLRAAERRYPGIRNLPRQKRDPLIAQISDLPLELIEAAFDPEPRVKRRSFTEHMSQLQRIRNSL
ncbi:MAG: DUF4350 domain-containing protein [Pseudomonadota bacterium]